ncbi:hypothetical protein BCR44DRAFT_44194, partial [Catenaria anguillulae PL171]
IEQARVPRHGLTHISNQDIGKPHEPLVLLRVPPFQDVNVAVDQCITQATPRVRERAPGALDNEQVEQPQVAVSACGIVRDLPELGQGRTGHAGCR